MEPFLLRQRINNVGQHNITRFSKSQQMFFSNYDTIEKCVERQDITKEKRIIEKDNLTDLSKTLDEKDEIINNLNNKIKMLEFTLKEYESNLLLTPKEKRVISLNKNKVEIDLNGSNGFVSPKTQPSVIGKGNHYGKKKNFLFLKEVTNNVSNNAIKSSKKYDVVTSPEISSPKSDYPLDNRSPTKSPQPFIKHHHNSDNGGILNQLHHIRERTKSVLEQYKENNNSLMLKICSINKSEFLK